MSETAMMGFGRIGVEGGEDFDLSTGWYYDATGVKAYVIDGECVDRQTWLNYVGENAEKFSDPKWVEA